MTFEEWEKRQFEPNLVISAEYAWDYQQKKIDELEATIERGNQQLKEIDRYRKALEEIGSANWHFSMSRKIANEALKGES